MPVGIDESIGSVGFVNRGIHPLHLGHMQCRDPAQYQSQREDKQMFHKTFHTKNGSYDKFRLCFFTAPLPRYLSFPALGSVPPLTTNGETEPPQYLYHAIVPPRGER